MVFTGALRSMARGAGELEIEASNVRELLQALDARFPGFSQQVLEHMSIAIDGDIVQEPLLEPIASDSEVHFLPPISGGA